MTPRMFCTRCSRTAVADTLLPGSDRIEMLAWCAFAIPGFVYCWFRYWLRIKVCSHCGSDALVREARAAAARAGVFAVESCRITDASGRLLWPSALVSPRERLRRGAMAGALALAAGACLTALELHWVPPSLAIACAHACAASAFAWLALQGLHVTRLAGERTRCRAWDATGRPLPIERLG